MRNSNRIPIILNNINIIWQKYPDMRFFQLLEAIKFKINENRDEFHQLDEFFHFEDDELNKTLEKIKLKDKL